MASSSLEGISKFDFNSFLLFYFLMSFLCMHPTFLYIGVFFFSPYGFEIHVKLMKLL